MPEPNWNRSELASPGIISDTLPDIMNPLTGMPISSKSELRKQYKAAGVEEVGNEGIRTHPSERVCVPETPDRVLERQVAETVKQSLSQLTTDSLSNDQMANMLRAPAPKNDLGLAVE
jgi:IMP dehydrogenase/GMP reductase